jgi:hypothetical protein
MLLMKTTFFFIRKFCSRCQAGNLSLGFTVGEVGRHNAFPCPSWCPPQPRPFPVCPQFPRASNPRLRRTGHLPRMKGRGKEGGELGSCDRLHALLHRSAGVGVPNSLQHTGDTAPRKKPREWAMAFFFLPRQPLPSYLRNILAGGYWPPHWTRESPVVLPTAAFWGPGRTTYGYCCWLLKLLVGPAERPGLGLVGSAQRRLSNAGLWVFSRETRNRGRFGVDFRDFVR